MRKAVSRSWAWRGDSAARRKAARSATPSASLVVLAEQRALQPVEQRELLVRRKRRVVGDVVGGAHEIVEGQNDAAMARMDQPRRDGKILVAMRPCRNARPRGAGHGVARQIGLGAAFPHAAAAAPILKGGIQREEHVEHRDRRQRKAPQRRDAVEAQRRLECERHRQPAARPASRAKPPANSASSGGAR